jgi:hypothetical protein
VRFHRGKANKRVELSPPFSSPEKETSLAKKRAMSFVVYLIKVEKSFKPFSALRAVKSK